MSLLSVRLLGDPVLRTVAEPVLHFDESLAQTAHAMYELLTRANVGIGLAAPQIGISQRLVVWDDKAVPAPDSLPKEVRGTFVNLEILEQSGLTNEGEGCLSFPGEYFEVERSEWVRARFQTVNGESIVFETDGLLASLVQHELDHLNGKMIVDHIPRSDFRRALSTYTERLGEAGIAEGTTSISMDTVDHLFSHIRKRR